VHRDRARLSPQTANSLRVTVINMHTKEPVAGAKVVIDTSTAALATAADGTASFGSVTGTHDLHVFAAGYSYTSFVQTAATDLLVPLVPYVFQPAQRVTGHMCSSLGVDNKCAAEGEFAPLNKSNQPVHLAILRPAPSQQPARSLRQHADRAAASGDSLADRGNCLHRRLAVPDRSGLQLGGQVRHPGQSSLWPGHRPGDDFFATQDYRLFADGGLRALWGIGGNLTFNDLLPVVPALTGGANVEVGTLLPKLLPLFSVLQAGATLGVKAPDNGTPQHAPTFASTSVALTTPMRLRIAPKSPDLPMLDGLTSTAS